MTVVSKIELSRIQLEKAIQLFLEEHDFICSHTLAGAAEGMLGTYVKLKNGQSACHSLLEQWQKLFPATPVEKIKTNLNLVRNELKHVVDARTTHVAATEEEAAHMIMRGCLNYLLLQRSYTPQMAAFSKWYEKKYGGDIP